MNKISIIIDSQPLEIDLDDCKLISVANEKHVSVELCVEIPTGGFLFPIAKIKLYNDDRFISSERTFEGAKALGEKISNAFNAGYFFGFDIGTEESEKASGI